MKQAVFHGGGKKIDGHHGDKRDGGKKRSRMEGQMKDNMVYMWLSPILGYQYVGKSSRSFEKRTYEHERQLWRMGNGGGSTKEIPSYAVMRRHGASLYFPIPSLHMANSDDVGLRYCETKLIQYFHAKLNMPFIRKYIRGNRENGGRRVVQGRATNNRRREKKKVEDLVKRFPNMIMSDDTEVKCRKAAMEVLGTRRKGMKGVKAMGSMNDEELMQTRRLVYNYGQKSSQMDIVQKRLGVSILDCITLTIKLPVLPNDRHLREWMKNKLIKQFKDQIMKGPSLW